MIPMKMTKVSIEGDTILLEADIQEKKVPEGDGLEEKVLLEKGGPPEDMDDNDLDKDDKDDKDRINILLIPPAHYIYPGKEPIVII